MDLINKKIKTEDGSWKILEVMDETIYSAIMVAEKKTKRSAVKQRGVIKLIKVYACAEFKQRGLDEANIHRNLKHENIVAFIESGLYKSQVYIAMELAAQGSVFSRMKLRAGSLGKPEARHYFRQLVAGLAYMHGRGVAHRDIKSKNLLIDAAGTLKICDFDAALVFSTSAPQVVGMFGTTKAYRAPEVTRTSPHSPIHADIWSAGVVLIEMLIGGVPWVEASLSDGRYAGWVEKRYSVGGVWKEVTPPIMEMLNDMMRIYPTDRTPLASVGADPWMLEDIFAKQLSQTSSGG